MAPFNTEIMDGADAPDSDGDHLARVWLLSVPEVGRCLARESWKRLRFSALPGDPLILFG